MAAVEETLKTYKFTHHGLAFRAIPVTKKTVLVYCGGFTPFQVVKTGKDCATLTKGDEKLLYRGTFKGIFFDEGSIQFRGGEYKGKFDFFFQGCPGRVLYNNDDRFDIYGRHGEEFLGRFTNAKQKFETIGTFNNDVFKMGERPYTCWGQSYSDGKLASIGSHTSFHRGFYELRIGKIITLDNHVGRFGRKIKEYGFSNCEAFHYVAPVRTILALEQVGKDMELRIGIENSMTKKEEKIIHLISMDEWDSIRGGALILLREVLGETIGSFALEFCAPFSFLGMINSDFGRKVNLRNLRK